MPQMQEGIVQRYFPDRGFGFIKRDGGPDVFFHIKDAGKLVPRDGTFAFTRRDADVLPAVGARVLFELRPDGDREKAAPWGLPDAPAPVAEFNFATAPIGELAARKRGDVFSLIACIQATRSTMSETLFRVFAALTPDGEELWKEYKVWHGTYKPVDGSPDPGFLGYVGYVLVHAPERMQGPRRCLYSNEVRSLAVMYGLAGKLVTNDDRIGLFLEDPAVMRRLAPSICGRCQKMECPNYLSFGNRS